MSATVSKTRLEAAVWRALDTVRDPELDQPVTELGFVASATVSADGEVDVRLRLPTYFCAPNFAFMMVADAHDALRALPEVTGVRVRLLDHFASDEINAGVTSGEGFAATFPGLAEGELAQLRRRFQLKAHTACQEVVARRMLTAGTELAALTSLTLGSVRGRVPDVELERLQRRRADLGFPEGPDAPLLLDDEGAAVPSEGLSTRLRFARTTRVSIESNAGWCRGLLHTRYGDEVEESK